MCNGASTSFDEWQPGGPNWGPNLGVPRSIQSEALLARTLNQCIFKNKLFIFNWRIIALQYCVGFWTQLSTHKHKRIP